MALKTPKEKHDHETLKFPEGFLWGSATSAHQVEGNNINSDWWEWEQKRPPRFRSGDACDQYNKYEEDFDLVKQLNHNSHRLSIEWSRIEPKEGEFDQGEIEHYKKVLKSLKDKNLTVMLTLWHFTLPKWVSDKGGWENGKTVKYFEGFVKKIVPEAVLIFIKYEEGDLEQSIRHRIKNDQERGETTEEEIRCRIVSAQKEAEYEKYYDHVVTNPEGKPDEAVKEIEKIIGGQK